MLRGSEIPIGPACSSRRSHWPGDGFAGIPRYTARLALVLAAQNVNVRFFHKGEEFEPLPGLDWSPDRRLTGQASLWGGTGVGASITRVASHRSLDRLTLAIWVRMKGNSMRPRCENPEDSAAHPKTLFRSADTAIASGE